MKTLSQYLLLKLSEVRDNIRKTEQTILHAATSSNIDIEVLQKSTQKLNQYREDYKYFTEEICKHLSVDIVVENKDILDRSTVGYAYNYLNKVTVEDATKLTKAFYGIRPEIKS